MNGQQARRPIEGGAGNDLLLGTRRNDSIFGFTGDDIIVGRRGRDLMYGGDGSDTFAFDDQDTGDASWGLADSIADFGAEDVIDLLDTEVLGFAGYDNDNPGRGRFSIWESSGHVYVTWNTYGSLHDLELTDFNGDYYNLHRQIRWYADDYLGSPATDAEVSPEAPVQGRIEVSGDEDWFRVDVEAGQLYVFDLKGQADGGGTLADPLLVLYDESGNYVTDRYEELYFVAETDGTYFIAATSWRPGTYTLDVTETLHVDDFGNDVNTSGRIEPGDSVTGEIEIPDDQDWLRIELEAGQLYSFDLMGQADGGGTLVDPVLVLYDESGNYVISSYEELQFFAPASGSYFIAATSWSQGTYTLEVTAAPYIDDFGSDITTNGQIGPGETRTGEIGVPNDEDWFRIDLEAGETYTINLRGQSEDFLYYPLLRLLDAEGQEIASNTDGSYDYGQIVYTAGTGGTYFIAAQATDASETGGYQLSLSDPAAVAADDLLLAG